MLQRSYRPRVCGQLWRRKRLEVMYLDLFGTGRARYDEHPLPGFPSQQPYLLLCYLVLNRHHPHSREMIAAQFWGDYPTSTSRKYLRNALWRLRHSLESAGVPVDRYLQTLGDSIAFTPGQCRLDIELFETTVTHYEHLPGHRLMPEQAVHLETATDLYTGFLLEGCYEEWCLHERERLHLLYLSALGKLMDFHEVNGTYDRGLACGKRILSYDDTHERVHRQMMRLYWLLGDRNAAREQYRRCAKILRETMDVSPMPATRRLYERVINRSLPAGTHSASPPSRPTSTGSGQTAQQLISQALQRLQDLEADVEETKAELRRISGLLQSLVGVANHSSSSAPEDMR